MTSATVVAQYNANTGRITLTENITSGYGPFSLVLSISNVNVTLLSQNLSSPIPLTTGSTGAVSPF